MQVKRAWLGVILLIVLGVVYTWATWRYFTLKVPGGNDFLAMHYSVWQAYVQKGYSPYSDDAALYTQQMIRGRPALPGEDQNRLTYPFYSILLYVWFIWLDYPLARAIYMTLLQVVLFIGIYMTLNLFQWKIRGWLLAIVLAWSLLFYPVARGVILGQFAIVGFFSLAGALYYLMRKRDILAGSLLVISTIKPTLVFLVVPFLLIWAIFRRRWHFVISFVGIVIGLSLASMIVYPSWIGDWLYRIIRYSEYTVGQSPVWLLTHAAVPGLGQVGDLLITAFLIIGMLWTWWKAFRPGGEMWFYWSLGITLVVSNLIVQRSATTNYVLMFVPTLWIFAVLERSFTWGKIAVWISMLVSFVGLWWLHFATVVGNQEQPIMFIPYPLILGLVLLVGRRWLQEDARRIGIVA